MRKSCAVIRTNASPIRVVLRQTPPPPPPPTIIVVDPPPAPLRPPPKKVEKERAAPPPPEIIEVEVEKLVYKIVRTLSIPF